MEQAYTLLPFDNVVMTMDLPGSAVLALLEQSAVSERGVLQMSGISVTYDPAKPVGARTTAALVGGKALDPAKVYRVAVNDFLAAGGDDFKQFLAGKNIVYGENLRDLFVTYLKQHSPVAPRIEGRTGTR